jgi:hypothetical protein
MNSNFKKDIHYVWLGSKPHELSFTQYLSIVSSIMYCDPNSINIWSEVDFYGRYYEILKHKIQINKKAKPVLQYGENNLLHP